MAQAATSVRFAMRWSWRVWRFMCSTRLVCVTLPRRTVVSDQAREELAGLVRTRHVLVDKRADLRKVAAAAPGGGPQGGRSRH